MADLRILFIRLRSLGDIVLMTPALAVAKRTAGTVVGVVCEEPFDQILRENPNVDQLFVSREQMGKLRSRANLIRQIRNFQPHISIDLHGGTTSRIFTLFSGAGKRVGYASNRGGLFYNCLVPDSRQVWQKESLHTVEHQLSPLKHLGFEVEPIPALQVPVTQADSEAVRRLLQQKKVEEGFVLIQPAAAFETKRWDIEKFAQLARRLLKDGAQVVVTAGPGEERFLVSMESKLGSEICLVTPLSLSRFAALAAQCRLLVGNDTGTTHVAAALGRRIVVVFGSSDWRVWYPWGVDFRLVKSELPCMPCPGYSCSQYAEPRCIRSIAVESVYEAVRSLLG